jgi:hypothetical protein
LSFSKLLWLFHSYHFLADCRGAHDRWIVLFEDPARLFIKLVLFPVAAEAAPQLRIFLVAHETWLDFSVKLFYEVSILEFLVLSECPNTIFGVLVIAVALVGPHYLDVPILLHNLLGDQSLLFALDNEALRMQEELDVVLALTKPLYQILLEIIESLREEAHALSFLVDLFDLRCRWVLDHERLRVELIWIELEDVFKVGPGLQLEIVILLDVKLSVDTLVRQDQLHDQWINFVHNIVEKVVCEIVRRTVESVLHPKLISKNKHLVIALQDVVH